LKPGLWWDLFKCSYSDLGHFMFYIHMEYIITYKNQREDKTDDGQEGERSSLTFLAITFC